EAHRRARQEQRKDQDADRRGPGQLGHQLRRDLRRRGPAAQLGFRPARTDPAAHATASDSKKYRRLATLVDMTAPAAPSMPMAAGHGPQLLIVEDDVGIATQLVRGLIRGGYRVDHVTTGQEALERSVPDVVLLDLELPDGDGVNVCRKLRQRTDI